MKQDGNKFVVLRFKITTILLEIPEAKQRLGNMWKKYGQFYPGADNFERLANDTSTRFPNISESSTQRVRYGLLRERDCT